MNTFNINSITLNYENEELSNAIVFFSRDNRLNPNDTTRIRSLNGSIEVSREDYESANGDITQIKERIQEEVNNYFTGTTTGTTSSNTVEGATYLGGGWYELPNGEKVQGLDEVENQIQSTEEEITSTETGTDTAPLDNTNPNANPNANEAGRGRKKK